MLPWLPFPCSGSAPAPARRTRRAPRAPLRPSAWLSAAVWGGPSPATPPTRGAGRPLAAPALESGSAPWPARCPRLPQSAVTSPSQGHRPGAGAGLERNGQLPAPQDAQGGAEGVCARLRWAHAGRISRTGRREGMWKEAEGLCRVSWVRLKAANAVWARRKQDQDTRSVNDWCFSGSPLSLPHLRVLPSAASLPPVPGAGRGMAGNVLGGRRGQRVAPPSSGPSRKYRYNLGFCLVSKKP